mmetsp:Transcript_6273/g.9634  ORF Transcript_6273/g.9634 Transcript_6273/m.9634 type:complete len:94 (-) Transcript_6273:94-375(-)
MILCLCLLLPTKIVVGATPTHSPSWNPDIINLSVFTQRSIDGTSFHSELSSIYKLYRDGSRKSFVSKKAAILPVVQSTRNLENKTMETMSLQL